MGPNRAAFVVLSCTKTGWGVAGMTLAVQSLIVGLEAHSYGSVCTSTSKQRRGGACICESCNAVLACVQVSVCLCGGMCYVHLCLLTGVPSLWHHTGQCGRWGQGTQPCTFPLLFCYHWLFLVDGNPPFCMLCYHS